MVLSDPKNSDNYGVAAQVKYCWRSTIQSELDDMIRKQLEQIDYFGGFLQFVSLQGGMAQIFCQTLQVNYRKKPVVSVTNMPEQKWIDTLSPVIEPYNFGMNLMELDTYIDMNLCYTNSCLRDYCSSKRRQEMPGFAETNDLVSDSLINILSGTNQSQGCLDIDLLKLIQNTYGADGSKHLNMANLSMLEVPRDTGKSPEEQLLNDSYQNDYKKILEWNSQQLSLKIGQIKTALQDKTDVKPMSRLRSFYGFGIHQLKMLDQAWQSPTVLEIDNIKPHNTLFQSLVDQPLKASLTEVSIQPEKMADYLDFQLEKYQKVYSKRAFVHWIVGQGLESGELDETKYNYVSKARMYRDFNQSNQQQDNQNE